MHGNISHKTLSCGTFEDPKSQNSETRFWLKFWCLLKLIVTQVNIWKMSACLWCPKLKLFRTRGRQLPSGSHCKWFGLNQTNFLLGCFIKETFITVIMCVHQHKASITQTYYTSGKQLFFSYRQFTLFVGQSYLAKSWDTWVLYNARTLAVTIYDNNTMNVV